MADKTTTATGGLDSSIPLGIKTPEPINLLGMAGQAQQLQNAANANKLFQARQAAGDAFLNSIGPDGIASQNQLLLGLKGNPNTAAFAQDAAAQGQGLAQAQQTRSKEAQGLVNQGIASLGALPDADLTNDAIKAKVSSMLQGGVLTPQDAQAALSDLPPDGASVTARRGYILRHLVANVGGAEQAQTLYGTNITNNTGQGIQGGTQASPAMGGGLSVSGGQLPTGLPSPAGLVEQQTVLGPNGQPVSITKAQLLRQQGVDPTNPLGTGRAAVPPALMGPNAGSGAPAPASGVPGGVVVGQSPAQVAAQTATGGDSAKHFQDVSAQGQQAVGQSAILSNMLTDAAQFSQGPGQENIKAFQSQLQRFAPGIATAFGVKPDSIAANESFDKFANQLANAQGAGSDARLAVNQGANPSSHLTPAGVDLVLRQLQGNADFLKAKQAVAASYPDKTDSQGFEAQVSKTLDPRYFQFARMNDKQQAAYWSALKKSGEAAAFAKGYAALHDGPLGSLLQTGQ